RFLVLAEAGLGTANRLLVLFLERFLEMWSLALVCLGLALAFRGHGASTTGLIGLVGGYSGAVLGAGALGLLLARHHRRGPPPTWARRLGLHAGRWRIVQRQVRQLRTSVRALRGANVGRMLVAYGASVLHIAGKVAVLPAIVFLADRTFPMTMDTLAPLVLWPLALFYGGVVVPAPGGGGVIEGAFTFALGDAIPAATFAAALLWWRFYTYYVYLLVGGLAAGDTVRRLLAQRTPDLATA
ncbi:MAG TPA: lysylphosphatidylglycerol synthase domain-containing protein, partial [Gemmatimonadaceae bacterium]|nr:lysylphosphatidylglycerol synthase domain-containing protein [Gemmatimonadaceae bacterium]